MSTDVQEIGESLQHALELEFFTIPPYLSALYSLHEGNNREARDVIQSVVMEEMLHMMLVANVLNAIGGKPVLHTVESGKGKLRRKTYPAPIPHITGSTVVNLLPFGTQAIETFMAIEAPEESKGCNVKGTFSTIGEFYQDIRNRLVAACEQYGEEKVFTGDKEVQVRRKTEYYGGGGEVIAVYCLGDAMQALGQVMEQGEGRLDSNILSGNAARFGQPRDAAHFFRFKQIKKGRYYQDQNNVLHDPQGGIFEVDWDATYPMQPNPPFPDTPNEAQAAFIDAYRNLLQQLELGLQGDEHALARSVTYMHALGHAVRRLMKVPNDKGQTLGAPFWYVLS